MSFLNADGSLDGQPHARTYGEEVRIVLSALDCVLNGELAIYASSELTSGRRLYQLLRANGVRTARELELRLGAEEVERLLRQPNLAAAESFARELRQRSGGQKIVVTPAPFTAPGWNQQEYLALWELLIRTRFQAVYFNVSWYYSNGCAFEFAVAQDAGLPTYDAAGQRLGLAAGREHLASAARELELEGFDATGLHESLARLAGREREVIAQAP
jgi:hypothetical protein